MRLFVHGVCVSACARPALAGATVCWLMTRLLLSLFGSDNAVTLRAAVRRGAAGSAAGRVKKCSSKLVELVDLGRLRVEPGWHNGGYIFPDGFLVRTAFRSSVRCSSVTACLAYCIVYHDLLYRDSCKDAWRFESRHIRKCPHYCRASLLVC